MSRRPAIFIAALCAIYIAVRLWRLTDSCLWFDEIFSVHAAEHPWGSIFWFVAQDLIHPPLFYVLLKLWIGIGGESLLWLRLFPVLFSIAALIPFINLCRELKVKTSTTILALSFFAVSGSLIKYAQEVRMYSLLLCLSLFSIWLFARFFYRGKNIWILTLVNVLLVYTHYFGWFVVMGEIAVIAILQRIKIRHVLIMFSIALIAYVPWMFALAKAASAGSDVNQNIGWMARPGLRAVFDFAFDVIEPFYFQQSNVDDSTKIFITLPLLLLIVAAMSIYLINWKSQIDTDRFWLLSILGAVPLFLAFIISWISPVSIWGSRHLIVVFAPIFILIAVVITELARNPILYAVIGAVTLLFLAALPGYAHTPTPQFIWCAWKPLAAQWIAAPHYSPDPKKLYVFEDLVAYHFWFDTRELPNYSITVVKGIDGMSNDPAYFIPRGFDGVATAGLPDIGDDQFWIAFREPTKPEPPGLPFIGGSFEIPVTNFENRGYYVEDVKRVVQEQQTAYLIKMSKAN